MKRMLIFIHVMIALLSLAQAAYGLIAPSKTKLHVTYALTAATLTSGTYLVWHLHAAILSSCLSGLTFLALIIAASAATHYRLAKLTAEE